MFYDNFLKLCEKKGVSRTKACVDCDVSRTAWRKWEGGAVPNGATLNAFADYFGVTTGYLLGLEQEKFYSADVSRKMCEEISRVRKEQPEKFAHFLIPHDVWKQIQDGTYPFSDITFKQFSDVIGKTADDFLSVPDKALEGVDFALYGEAHDLTEDEKKDVLNFVKFLKSKRGEQL